MNKTFLIILLTFIFACTGRVALTQGFQGPSDGFVELSNQEGRYPLGLHLDILEDPSGQLTFDQISSPEIAARFYPSSEETLRFGVTRSAIWTRFRVSDLSKNIPYWLLEVNNATLENVDLYLPNPGGSYQFHPSGLLVPDSEQEIPDNHYVFQIPSGLQTDQPIYLRFATANSMTIPATLWSPAAFDQTERNEELIWGIYYGILLVMAVYNFLLFLSLHDRDYLFLVLYILAVLLQTAFIDGRIKDILPPELGYQYRYIYPIFAIPNLPALLLFTTSFLKVKQFAPRLHKAALWLFALLALLILLTFVINRYFVSLFFLLVSLLVVAVVGLSGLAAWRKGYRPARYFLLAMLIPLVLGFGETLSRLGLLPVIPYLYSTAHFGDAALVTILSLALADRIHYYQHQTEDALEEVRRRETLITEYMNALPIGVAVYGTDLKPRLVNQSALDLFKLPNYDPGSTLERSVQELNLYTSGSDTPLPVEDLPVYQALAGESNHREDIEIEIDSQRIPLEIVATPISNPDGSIQYAISAFRDISERREQEMAVRVAQELYESLVEKEALLICRFTREGSLTFVNRAYCDYFGSTREELLGSSFIDVINESEQDIVRSGVANINPDNPLLLIEYHVVNRDGEIRWQRWTNQGFFDDNGNLIEYQATGEDITEQKLIEAQLTHYRENLEELVAERTRQERHQRAIAESLQSSASVLNSDLHLDKVLIKILEQLPKVVALDNAAIYLKDGEDLVLSNATADYQNGQGLKFPLSLTRTPFVKVFMERKSLFYADMETDPDWNEWEPTFQIRSWIGTPLRAGDEVIGVLSVSSATPDLYSKDELPVLEAFANHATIAIVNARLYEGTRRAAALEERNRLARDLHDSVTQTLFSASIIAQALPLQWERDQDGAQANLSRLHQLTSGALAEMRLLLLELRSGSLEKYPLSTLMSNLCEAFQAKNNIPIDLKLSGDATLDSLTEVKEYFYRITQEALNNIAKHSKASHVEIHLVQTEESISLRIQDDGKGFDSSNLEPGHFGLQIMRERAAVINAILQIDSRPGTETVIFSEWKRSS